MNYTRLKSRTIVKLDAMNEAETLENTLLQIEGVEIGHPTGPDAVRYVWYRGAGLIGSIDTSGALTLHEPAATSTYRSLKKSVDNLKIPYTESQPEDCE